MDSKALEQFESDGYVIMRGLLPQSVVETTIKGASKLVNELAERLIKEGKVNDSFTNDTLETRFFKLLENCVDEAPLLYRAELHLQEFYSLFSSKEILACVHQILPKADVLRIFPNYSIRPKLPHYDGHDIAWHQDAGLAADGGPNMAPIEARQSAYGPHAMVNCWTPLVKATRENGCMLFIPGSHKLGIQSHIRERRYRPGNEKFQYGLYSTQIDPDVVSMHKDKAIFIECIPGDVVFFSHMLFHKGSPNQSETSVRWSVDWRYQDASKPTYRQENGHIIWSRLPNKDVVDSPSKWASLTLS